MDKETRRWHERHLQEERNQTWELSQQTDHLSESNRLFREVHGIPESGFNWRLIGKVLGVIAWLVGLFWVEKAIQGLGGAGGTSHFLFLALGFLYFLAYLGGSICLLVMLILRKRRKRGLARP